MSPAPREARGEPSPRVPDDAHWVEPIPTPGEPADPPVVDDGEPTPDHGCTGCHTDFTGLSGVVKAYRAMPEASRKALLALGVDLARELEKSDHYMAHIDNDDFPRGRHSNEGGS